MFNETHVLRTTIRLTVLLGCVGAIWKPSVGLSLFLGGIISYLTFRLLIIDATRLLQTAKQKELTRKQASKYNWRGFIKRCSLYAGAIIIAILNPNLNFLSTLVGLLISRLAITYNFLLGRINRGT